MPSIICDINEECELSEMIKEAWVKKLTSILKIYNKIKTNRKKICNVLETETT